jgi:hypothetical protein
LLACLFVLLLVCLFACYCRITWFLKSDLQKPASSHQSIYQVSSHQSLCEDARCLERFNGCQRRYVGHVSPGAQCLERCNHTSTMGDAFSPVYVITIWGSGCLPTQWCPWL